MNEGTTLDHNPVREAYALRYPMDSVQRDFADYVRHMGKCWFNPHYPLDYRGGMALWSLREDGLGTTADPARVRSCTPEEIEAIEYFQMTKITDYQLRQMVCTLVGTAPSNYAEGTTMDEFVAEVVLTGDIRIPPGGVYVIPERVAVLAAVSKPRGSWLIQQLQDRPLETAFVADSIYQGTKALFIAALLPVTTFTEALDMWMQEVRNPGASITIRPVDSDYSVMAASVSCFVQPH